MVMKRICWLIVVLMTSVAMSAQTQQGVVKTRGRMVNGQLKPGVPRPQIFCRAALPRDGNARQQPESEKQYDRVMAEDTFKLLTTLGYKIEKDA